MTYDATAQKVAVKVIGTVESNLDYQAVNYGDPITVGIAQWYGVRAAGILDRMRDQNPGSWYGVEPSIDSQLASIASSDPWWNSRRLTQAEGVSLLGPMGRNQDIQNQQLTEDLDGYKQVAVNNGIDPDNNTATMIFFFTMYHQGPTYAFQVLNDCGPSATLDQIFAACMANPVLGQYGSRYNTAYHIISQNDFTGVDPAPPPPAPAPSPTNGNARFIQQVGDTLAATFSNGEKIFFYPNGSGMWTPRKGQLPPPAPAPVQPPPPADNGEWTAPLSAAGGITMSSPYGPRPTPAGTADINGGFHYGCDFVPADGGGADVVAPCPLLITVAWEYGTPNDPSNGTAGTYAKGHTTDGAYTFNFYHMVAGSLAVSVGDTVDRGQRIGAMGGTGNVTGPHLHFEAYEGAVTSPWPPPYGNPIDPLPVLRAHGVNV